MINKKKRCTKLRNKLIPIWLCMNLYYSHFIIKKVIARIRRGAKGNGGPLIFSKY